MQVERKNGVSGVAKATETARTEGLAMGKTGEWNSKIFANLFGLETENWVCYMSYLRTKSNMFAVISVCFSHLSLPNIKSQKF